MNTLPFSWLHARALETYFRRHPEEAPKKRKTPVKSFTGIIYKYVNRVNGKVYVGQTVYERRRRFEHRYINNGQKNAPFHKAIVKYGWESFDYEVIHKQTYLNAEEAKINQDLWEVLYIALYEAYESGYNCNYGGGVNYGNVVSEETKARLRASQSIPIHQYDLYGNFIRGWGSATEAANELGLQHANISSCCKGKAMSAGGFIWRLESDNTSPREYDFKHKLKPIYQIDITTGKILKSFESLKDASTELNIDISSISATCRGEMNYYKGFIWVFQSDYSVEDIKRRLIRIEQINNHYVSEETRRKMSERNKGVNNPNYGKTHSEEAKRRISLANSGRKQPPKGNPVYQLSMEGEIIRQWRSSSLAEAALNGKKTGLISKVLKGVKQSAFGFKWRLVDMTL